MFRELISQLYIGKSRLTLLCNGRELPQTTLIMDAMQPTGYSFNLPDYCTFGNFSLDTREFEITPMMPRHRLFVTGIPKNEILDNFRLQEVIWSSYYEDNIKGYLFQITRMGTPKLIIG